MKINNNSTALLTNNYLMKSENSLQKSIGRLSSGYKINKPGDNPSGYAISSKMRSQIDCLTKATGNATDGVSVIETAEGAVAEIQSMIQRMNQLAVQSANGTNTTADRNAIQTEVKALCSEISRLAVDTEFNTQPLIDGNFELKGYTDNAKVKVQYYSDETRDGDYTINISKDATGVYTIPQADLNKIAPNAIVSQQGDLITIEALDGTEIKLDLAEDAIASGGTAAVKLDLTGIGAMRLQIGANEGQILELSIPEISLKKMGLEGIDCTTAEGAKRGIGQLTEALSYTSMVRSKLGAYQNRLDHAIASLDVTSENMTSSYSRITDTDMAKEMTEYTRLQVLQQAGTSMLAQANEFPQQALQLLQ